jgi:elongation factor G
VAKGAKDQKDGGKEGGKSGHAEKSLRVGRGEDLDLVRNIGIAAHIDAGKTTLTERILYYTGASHKIGEVHEGNTHTDYMPEERAHGITITSAVTKCPWKDHLIQVIDTPGHVDFTIEVERSMRVLDGAVIVMDGVRGVEPQTETVWRQASKFGVPRLVFVNKMDRPGASFDRSMESLRKRLGANTVPVCVPIDDGGVMHLIEQRCYRFSGERGEVVTLEDIPALELDTFRRHREAMLVAAAELDPSLEEAVFMGEEVEPDLVWAALRKGTLALRIIPVFGGTALRNRGVQPLLDGVLKLLPNPLERPPAIARLPDGSEELVEMTSDGPLAAIAFKVQLWEGRRHVFVRVYRGKLEPGVPIRIAGRDKEERVARVFDVDADAKKRIDVLSAGQIGLLAGLRWATTGDTLCDPEREVFLEKIDSKEPVLGLAVEPESSKEEEKFLEVMAKVCEEDPTLRFVEDKDTGQRVLRGMGELHLQIVFERIEREFGLKVHAGKPRVMSRETIAGPGTGDALVERTFHITETKELHLKARCLARARPRDRNTGMELTVSPRVLPEGALLTATQLEAVRSGVNDAVLGGPVEGSPLQDVAVQLLEVELFGEATTAQALRMAASQAVREALANGGGQVLRPLMRIEVVVPDENLGGVLGDLQSRRSNIHGQEAEMGMSTIAGECPLEGLLGYTTVLRSITRGRGSFTMEFARFDVS